MDNEKKNTVSRRDFVISLWAIAASFPFIYTILKFISPPSKPFITNAERNSPNFGKLEIGLSQIPENSSKLMSLEGEPVLIIRKKGNEVTALSAICTHMNCTVGFRRESNEIYCSCHGGRFSSDGNVIAGPPKKPLAKYSVAITENKIIVTRPG